MHRQWFQRRVNQLAIWVFWIYIAIAAVFGYLLAKF